MNVEGIFSFIPHLHHCFPDSPELISLRLIIHDLSFLIAFNCVNQKMPKTEDIKVKRKKIKMAADIYNVANLQNRKDVSFA